MVDFSVQLLVWFFEILLHIAIAIFEIIVWIVERIILFILRHLKLHMIPKRFALFEKMWAVPFGDKFQSGFDERMTYKRVHRVRQFLFGTKFLRNLYIPIGNRDALEVDLVVIGKKNIYVYMTKNIRGTITGNEGDRYWTVTKKDDTSYQVKNPIRQARVIAKRIQELIGYRIYILSYIVFPNETDFSQVNYSTSGLVLVHKTHIQKNLSLNWHKEDANLSKTIVDDIYQTLAPYQKGRNPQKASAQRKTA